jgi:RNA polymerase sigma-70 factor (ECF subfamily)
LNDTACNFPEIYASYYPKILRYLSHLVGTEEAEDLTQEVFIKAARALPSFRGDSSLSTWLYRIATNTATDRLRSATFRHPEDTGCEVIEEGLESDVCPQEKLAQAPAGSILVENQVLSREMSSCIQRYIDQLPDSYRTVIVLSDLEGLHDKEIARILGVSLEAMKIRLHRARKKLRDQFLDHCEYYWVSELSWRAS